VKLYYRRFIPRCGILEPSRRAWFKAIAIACLRLRTLGPLRDPERNEPSLNSCMVLRTLFLPILPSFIRPGLRTRCMREFPCSVQSCDLYIDHFADVIGEILRRCCCNRRHNKRLFSRPLTSAKNLLSLQDQLNDVRRELNKR